jgi:flavin-dependent dehydrogenase
MEETGYDQLPRATGVVVSRKGQPAQTINAKVVVDATGTSALISKRLKIRVADPKLRKASIFAHYKGARRDEGKNAGATLVVSTKDHDGWFWYIPLPDDVVSIGVVGELDNLITGRGTPEETLDEEIRGCRGLDDRMVNAQRVSPVHVLSDFSWRSTRCAGDGWVLVGDAFGFLDPVYSSGVFLALKSGEMAADCIIEGLQNNDLTASQLSKWGQPLADGMQAMRKLVYAFYTKTFSFGQFMRMHPQYKKNLVDLLIGDVFRPEENDVNGIFDQIGDSVMLPEPLRLDPAPTREMAMAM